jgi:hypothetical protein
MGWKAASEQQQEALWRIFLMFVVMALIIIRTGLVSRGVVAVLSCQNARQDATSAASHEPSSTSPVDVRQATLMLLRLAEAAGRLFILNARESWELMNQPPPVPRREKRSNIGSLCERPAQRLDTS